MVKLKKPSKPKTTTEEKGEERKVIYDRPSVELFWTEGKKGPMTADIAKELLGWEEEGTAKFSSGCCQEIRLIAGVKVRLHRNTINRPLYTDMLRQLRQEILRRRWQRNLESIVIGQYGNVTQGQHRLIALVLACVEWESDREKYAQWWPDSPPTIETLVAYGAEETDAVLNTYDTGKPRSFSDAIYHMGLLADLPGKERQIQGRMIDYAVRLIWLRTGASVGDTFKIKRNHTEGIDFFNRHPRILECVRHVRAESGDKNNLVLYCSPGYLSGLLYLFGCSGSDQDAYFQREPVPSEEVLDWSHWNRAQDFIVLLAKRADEVQAVRRAFAGVENPTNPERWALLVKAWCAFRDHEPITDKTLRLERREDEDGVKHLDELPTVGGIDIYDGDNRPDVIAARVAEVWKKKEEAKSEDSRKKNQEVKKPIVPKSKKFILKRASRAGSEWAKGDVAWVCEPGEEPYLGKLLETPYQFEGSSDSGTTVRAGDGKWPVRLSQLRLIAPGGPMPGKSRLSAPITPKGKRPKPKKTSQHAVGNVRWVSDSDDVWRGKITAIEGDRATLRVLTGFRGAGSSRSVPLKSLSRAQPAPSSD